jgi:hypothetical protein
MRHHLIQAVAQVSPSIDGIARPPPESPPPAHNAPRSPRSPSPPRRLQTSPRRQHLVLRSPPPASAQNPSASGPCRPSAAARPPKSPAETRTGTAPPARRAVPCHSRSRAGGKLQEPLAAPAPWIPGDAWPAAGPRPESVQALRRLATMGTTGTPSCSDNSAASTSSAVVPGDIDHVQASTVG